MNLAHWLFRAAAAGGDRPALMSGEAVVADYAAFRDRAAAVAAALVADGVRPGDRVGLFMGNCPEFLIVLWGAWIAGAAVVPVNSKLHPREAAWILRNAGAARVFVTPDLGPGLAAVTDATMTDVTGAAFARMAQGTGIGVVHREEGDLAWLFYTSGTTGRPKGVMITHGMLAAMSLCYLADVDRVEPGDAALYAAPMSHGAGLYNPSSMC
jgi:long-chain acyl-CoA synthetase